MKQKKNYLEWVMCSAFFSHFVLSKKKLFGSKIYDIIIKLIQSSWYSYASHTQTTKLS